MIFRVGEFYFGIMGNFRPELTPVREQSLALRLMRTVKH